MRLNDAQRRRAVGALILALGAVSFVGEATASSVMLAVFTLLTGVLRRPTATRLFAVGGAVIVGRLCLGDASMMSHHRWLMASSLLWLGLPPRDDDALALARAQLIAVYVFGAIDKVTDAAWWSGARLLQIAAVTHPGPWLFDSRMPTIAMVVAVIVVAVEVGLASGLAFARTSVVACIIAVIFHGVIQLTLDVGVFSALAVVLALGTRRRPS
jgi:hypothetical protein